MTDRFRSGKLPGIFCVECKTHLSQERGEEKHNGGSYEDARDAETVKNQPFRNGCKADGKLNGRHGYAPCQFRLVRQGTGNPGGPADGNESENKSPGYGRNRSVGASVHQEQQDGHEGKHKRDGIYGRPEMLSENRSGPERSGTVDNAEYQ